MSRFNESSDNLRVFAGNAHPVYERFRVAGQQTGESFLPAKAVYDSGFAPAGQANPRGANHVLTRRRDCDSMPLCKSRV